MSTSQITESVSKICVYTLSEQANREVCAVWSSDGSGGVESAVYYIEQREICWKSVQLLS